MKPALLTAALWALAGAALAEPQDPVTALIRQQTEVFSTASQHGDQAAMDRLLDDRVLFASGDGAIQRDEKFDANDAVSADLKARTQAFHSADPGGVRAAMSGYADRAALFTDLTGAANRDSDFLRRRGDPPPQLTDWIVHHTDDVAVCSFTLHAGDAAFLAVEIWRREGPTWALVGGQAAPLYVDPPVAPVPAETLDRYAGAYSAGPGSLATIARDGDGLTYAANGGKPSSLKPLNHDTFFGPGLPAGYARTHTTFLRDATGQVAGFERLGIVYRRVDPAKAAGPFTPLVLGDLKLRAFVVHRTGDVAVAAFFHDRDTPLYGQVLHQTYRSMEAWIARDGVWKMISSQGREM